METKEFMNKRKARASWTTSRIMDVRAKSRCRSRKRVVGATRRIPLEYPAATNRLIRWIYDGWRGEIGSWPRVNLACVKMGAEEGAEGKIRGKRRTPDRFPEGFMPLFFIRPAREDVVRRVTASGTLSPGVPFFNSRLRFTALLARGSNTPRH